MPESLRDMGTGAVAAKTSEVGVRAISKRFGAFWALQDVSFVVRPGEILGLIGPNGSGKTTLFQCIAGVAASTAGLVSVADEIVPPHARKDALFYVPDGAHPWPDQRVAAILRFIAGLHAATDATRDRIIDAVAITALLGARMGDLSKGEHRRVMLAMGLLTSQPLLMLDEPFDGLDLRQTRETMNVLRAHRAAGRTLFLSVHQLNDAARVCDRFVLLSGGRVVGEGTLAELQGRAGLSDGGLEEVFLALT